MKGGRLKKKWKANDNLRKNGDKSKRERETQKVKKLEGKTLIQNK